MSLRTRLDTALSAALENSADVHNLLRDVKHIRDGTDAERHHSLIQYLQRRCLDKSTLLSYGDMLLGELQPLLEAFVDERTFAAAIHSSASLQRFQLLQARVDSMNRALDAYNSSSPTPRPPLRQHKKHKKKHKKQIKSTAPAHASPTTTRSRNHASHSPNSPDHHQPPAADNKPGLSSMNPQERSASTSSDSASQDSEGSGSSESEPAVRARAPACTYVCTNAFLCF
jgi:hypothetical protein